MSHYVPTRRRLGVESLEPRMLLSTQGLTLASSALAAGVLPATSSASVSTITLASTSAAAQTALVVSQPSTAAGIVAAINGAQAGDTVTLPAGTFDCSSWILSPKPGVTVAGAGQSATTIRGVWNIDLRGSSLPVEMRDFTCDMSGLSTSRVGTLDIRNNPSVATNTSGYVLLTRITAYGPPAANGNLIAFSAFNAPIQAKMVACVFHDAVYGADLVATVAGAGYGLSSRLELYGCEGYRNAIGGSDQCITAHNDFALYDYGGYYHDMLGPSAAAAGSGSTNGFTRMELHGTHIVGGCIDQVAVVEGCLLETGNKDVGSLVAVVANGVISGNHLILQHSLSWGGIMFGSRAQGGTTTTVENNFIERTANAYGIYGYHYSGNVLVSNNRISSSGVSGAAGICIETAAGYSSRAVFANNIIDGAGWTNSIAILGRYGTFSGDYNILQAPLSGYTPGAHDLTATAPQLNANGTPIAGGNCDATGNAAIAFALLTDLNGNQRVRNGTVCRGPIEPAAQVVGRKIFYNNSAWDGNLAAANVQDDAAIAPDKAALLPGGTATYANYTSYSRGINGIMIDIGGIADPAHLSLADFQFLVGNSNSPDAWTVAPAPTSISVRQIGTAGAGTYRVTLIWADGAISKEWLQVRVKATAVTGLTQDDVFYFGNAVGDVGNSTSNAIVNATDEITIRNYPTLLLPTVVTNPHDINRDKKVNATDQILARNNTSTELDALLLIAVPDVVAANAPTANAQVANTQATTMTAASTSVAEPVIATVVATTPTAVAGPTVVPVVNALSAVASPTIAAIATPTKTSIAATATVFRALATNRSLLGYLAWRYDLDAAADRKKSDFTL